MSHVTTFKTETEYTDLPTLREALMGLALTGLGELTCTYTDYYNKMHNCDLGIKTASFPRGFGFVKDGNKYTVKGDTFNFERNAAQLLKQIEMRYINTAAQKTLRGFNFMIVQEKPSEELIEVVARRY